MDVKKIRSEIEKLYLRAIEAGAGVSVGCPKPAIVDAVLGSGIAYILYEGEHRINEIWVTTGTGEQADPRLMEHEGLACFLEGEAKTAAELIAAAPWVDTKPEDAFAFFRIGGYDDSYSGDSMEPGWAWLEYRDVMLIETSTAEQALRLFC